MLSYSSPRGGIGFIIAMQILTLRYTKGVTISKDHLKSWVCTPFEPSLRGTNGPRAILDVFGPNLSTVGLTSSIVRETLTLVQAEGKDWQRHRKVTTPPFGEPRMGFVFDEAFSQARQMLKYWENIPDIRTTGKDVRRYSLHVLSATGFGKSEPYDPALEDRDSADGLSYKDALTLILENAVLVFAFGPKLLTSSIRHMLPAHWKLVGKATSYFRLHITNIIAEEKQNMDKHGGRSGNFISAMVRASEEERKMNEGDSRNIRHSPNSLSAAEIHGNIFVYNFAGHDSTAITLTYALTHLAANPGVQDWIAEEIQAVCMRGSPNYHEDFPRLKRCQAVVVSGKSVA